jgi:hypothetical protein
MEWVVAWLVCALGGVPSGVGSHTTQVRDASIGGDRACVSARSDTRSVDAAVHSRLQALDGLIELPGIVIDITGAGLMSTSSPRSRGIVSATSE